MTTSIGLAQDLKSGIIDRFRSLPMARSAVLAGRTFADLARSVLSLAIMVGLGVAVGFRFHNSVVAILAGMVVILGLRLLLLWVYATIGLATKDPETAQVAGDPALLHPHVRQQRHRPGRDHARLATAVRPQPTLSVTVSAVRALLEGGPRPTGPGKPSSGPPVSVLSFSPSRSAFTEPPPRSLARPALAPNIPYGAGTSPRFGDGKKCRSTFLPGTRPGAAP